MALISFAVNAKLICAFVFAYADCWFSHGVAHLKNKFITGLLKGHKDKIHALNLYRVRKMKRTYEPHHAGKPDFCLSSQLRSEANFCLTCFRRFFCQSCTLGFVPLFPKSVGRTVSENIYLFIILCHRIPLYPKHYFIFKNHENLRKGS